MKPITKIQKRNEKILQEFEKLMEQGWPKLEAYKQIGRKHDLSMGGVRYAIICARDLRRPLAGPIPQSYLAPYK